MDLAISNRSDACAQMFQRTVIPVAAILLVNANCMSSAFASDNRALSRSGARPVLVAGGALASDNVPQKVLDACDADADGDYNAPIKSAVQSLIEIGAFTDNDFDGVKIGFCSLRQFDGPVATTSCARNSILLDEKYANKSQSFVLRATLAHEMKHFLQHQKQKAAHGETYCVSAQYDADKEWMEVDADKFGDDVAGMLFVGRLIEIENTCPVTVRIYLDEGTIIPEDEQPHSFISAPPETSVSAFARSKSKFIKIFAESEHDGERQWVWQNKTTMHKRVVDGKSFGLTDYILSAKSPSAGPFLLKLSCS